MSKFFKLHDMRPMGRTYDIALSRVIAVSDIGASGDANMFIFHVMVDCGVEQLTYWCSHPDRATIYKERAELMKVLNNA